MTNLTSKILVRLPFAQVSSSGSFISRAAHFV
jgi:hypothetical protein